MTTKANQPLSTPLKRDIKVVKQFSSSTEVLKSFFELINLAVPKSENRLTDAEIQLLCLFMSLPQDKFKHQRFGKLAKKKVIEASKSLNWELSMINLNNKVYSMITKGFLARDEDGVITISNTIETAVNKLLLDKKITFNYELCYEEPANKSDDPN